MDEHRRSLIQVIQFNRCLFRGYFGESFADKWGFFVDRNMSTEIHSYLDWVDYPMGDRVLEGHKGEVYCAVTSRDGCYLFTGSKGGEIIKWDLRTNKVITRFGTHSTVVFSLAHTPGKLVSAGADKKIKVWNDEGCRRIHTLDGHLDAVNSVSLTKRGTILVSGSDDMTCRVWSLKSGECLRVMEGHTHIVRSVLFIGDIILSGSHDQSIRFWNPESGKELRKITDGIGEFMNDISLNSDSSTLVCCYFSGFTLFKYPSMEVIRTVDMICYSACFHPSNPTILAVSGIRDLSIRLHRTDTSEFTRNLEGHTKTVLTLRFSPDGSRLISLSADRTVRVWDVSDI